MFKRITKRQQKREREEELGLDEETKQILGLNATDSEESSDSSESDSDQSDEGNESDVEGTSLMDGQMDVDEPLKIGTRSRKRKRRQEDEGTASEEEEGSIEFDSLEDEYTEEEEAPMSILEALKDSIYDVPDAPETQDFRACIICPGKLLKNANMVKVHLQSSVHTRRMKRFTAEVERLKSSHEGLETEDPRDIVESLSEFRVSVPGETGKVSKRSQRRAEWKTKQKEKLKKKKEAKHARAKAEPSDTEKDVKRKKTSDKPVKGALPSVSASQKDVSKISTNNSSISESRPKKKGKVNSNLSSATKQKRAQKDRKNEGKTLGFLKSNIPKLFHRNTSLYFADDELEGGSDDVEDKPVRLPEQKKQKKDKAGKTFSEMVGKRVKAFEKSKLKRKAS